MGILGFLMHAEGGPYKNWVIFNGSYIMDDHGNFSYMRDYVIRQYPQLEQTKSEIYDTGSLDRWSIFSSRYDWS